jgi:ribosomal protein L32
MIDDSEYQALWTRSEDKSVLDEYQRLTGAQADASARKLMLSHRLSRYGPECPSCGKLLRSPKARFCAECGYAPPAMSDHSGEQTL